MAYGFRIATSLGMQDVSAGDDSSALLVAFGTITSASGTATVPDFDSDKGMFIATLPDAIDPDPGGNDVGFTWNNITKVFTWNFPNTTPFTALFFHVDDDLAPAAQYGINIRNNAGTVFFDTTRFPLSVLSVGSSTGVKFGDVYQHNLPRAPNLLCAVKLDDGIWGSWGLELADLTIPSPISDPIDPPRVRYLSNGETLPVLVLGFVGPSTLPQYGIHIRNSAGDTVWHSGRPVAIFADAGFEALQGADAPGLADGSGHWWVQGLPSFRFTLTLDFNAPRLWVSEQDFYGAIRGLSGSLSSGGGSRMRTIRVNTNSFSFVDAPSGNTSQTPWARMRAS